MKRLEDNLEAAKRPSGKSGSPPASPAATRRRGSTTDSPTATPCCALACGRAACGLPARRGLVVVARPVGGHLQSGVRPDGVVMVELGSRSPFGQSFNNSVFILPAIVVVFIVGFCSYKLVYSLKAKEERQSQRRAKREEKKTKKTK
ncbi:hypothetical protein KIN20_035500 [Parelaphostrongylus tenuis]|uniref:Small integral membrane protein 15 n=1 Tax=Parelaphostrongylus tenuis TaxID=148309 RepID=A0AAD5WJR5_PARTN|nr:hypothetical protein KIN20_035500 [Parelaphostrongylus tenuis]